MPWTRNLAPAGETMAGRRAGPVRRPPWHVCSPPGGGPDKAWCLDHSSVLLFMSRNFYSVLYMVDLGCSQLCLFLWRVLRFFSGRKLIRFNHTDAHCRMRYDRLPRLPAFEGTAACPWTLSSGFRGKAQCVNQAVLNEQDCLKTLSPQNRLLPNLWLGV